MPNTIRSASAAALALLALAACSSSTSPSGSTQLTQAEAQEVGASLQDEVSTGFEALSPSNATAPGIPASARVAAPTPDVLARTNNDLFGNCATFTGSADTDNDGVRDNVTFTFALPACQFTVGQAVVKLTGTASISDPQPTTPSLAFVLGYGNLTLNVTSGTDVFEVKRDGTRTLAATATTLTQTNNVSLVVAYPGKPLASTSNQLAATFTAAQGSTLAPNTPLPNGTITLTGTYAWTRAGVSKSFTATTPTPLVWTASCTADSKITAGSINFALSSGAGVTLTWTACGVEPTVTYVPAPTT